MAKRGREAAAKRARELARQQKRDDKRERAESRGESTPVLAETDEAALHEEFARLNQAFASEQVSEATFKEERERILAALGIEPS